MRLLVFAHRAEAQTFLKQGNYKSLESSGFPLYKNVDTYLTICSEGIYNALEATSIALAKFEEISTVINFGVAGALEERAERDKIYEVRTSYAIQNGTLEFKSYTSSSDSILDCITSSSRTLDQKDAMKLSCFANIVDRELWAIARASINFSKEFKAFKLISDEPYLGHEKLAICDIVKEKAEYYSDMLYRKYLTLSDQETKESKLLIEDYKDLYFTITQYRNYTTLISQLMTKYKSEEEVLSLVNIDKILNLDLMPKQRTSVLLEKLREMLTPFNTLLHSKVEEVLSPLHDAQIKTTLSKNLENDQLKISATINNEVELKKVARALTNLNYKSYQSLMKGDLDV